MRRSGVFGLLLAGLATPVFAQATITSSAPDSVAVSVYRAADRSSDEAMDLGWLEGYALITEQRTVAIPAGRNVIRFEGVAAGLFSESAIVTGLPSGVREKNLDADLLSPRSLYARAFGRPVIVRRTLPGSGKVTEERAVIRSGPEGAAILQTAAGFEVANCAGRADTLVYDGVPAELSARPTLSIETEAAAAQNVTLSLSYLAWGFDWQTNYVIRMNPDGRTADLSAWVTLASSDSTSFADAETAVIAGKVNREEGKDGQRVEPTGGELVMRCYLQSLMPPPAPPPPPPPMPVMAPAAMMEMADIVVTAQRAAPMKMNAPVTVQQEGLGDLKLYRVPVAVTVAANAQKQVALAQKPRVKFGALYRAEVYDDSVGDVRQLLRTRNRREEGLGLALPGGPVAVFEEQGGTMLLTGEGKLPDRAEGEDVEIELAESTQVTLESEELQRDKQSRTIALVARNARPVPVRFEARIATGASVRLAGSSHKLQRKDGRSIWAVSIPANGTSRVTYKIVNSD